MSSHGEMTPGHYRVVAAAEVGEIEMGSGWDHVYIFPHCADAVGEVEMRSDCARSQISSH